MSDETWESDETATVAPEETLEKPSTEIQEVTVREYPKTVLFYPMLIFSLILGIINYLIPFFVIDPTLRDSWLYTIAFVWFILFFFNLLIVTFEFGKSIVVALTLTLVIIVLVVVLVFNLYGYLFVINPSTLRLFISTEAFFAFFIVFLFVIFLSWIKTRMFYFKITPNEIIYKKGIMGDVERYGTTNVMVHKEIPDLFEFLLLRSGRLTISVPGRKTAIMLDNVPNINSVEIKILNLLRRIEVDID
ncbi:MAG: hypothetical protein ACFFCH_09360 [Promethearchaeota archaeon]